VAEVIDLLFAPFVENVEVALHEVGDKAALRVSRGDGNDHFIGGAMECGGGLVRGRRLALSLCMNGGTGDQRQERKHSGGPECVFEDG